MPSYTTAPRNKDILSICFKLDRWQQYSVDLLVPAPRRNMSRFWDWVLGLGDISRIMENIGDSIAISTISRTLENVADLVVL